MKSIVLTALVLVVSSAIANIGEGYMGEGYYGARVGNEGRMTHGGFRGQGVYSKGLGYEGENPTMNPTSTLRSSSSYMGY